MVPPIKKSAVYAGAEYNWRASPSKSFKLNEIDLDRSEVVSPKRKLSTLEECMCLAEVKKPRDYTRLTQEDVAETFYYFLVTMIFGSSLVLSGS